MKITKFVWEILKVIKTLVKEVNFIFRFICQKTYFKTIFTDSGGPIQIILPDSKCMYHIVGVTSFGGVCGGKNSPSIYTRVSSYIEWIEQKVWG